MNKENKELYSKLYYESKIAKYPSFKGKEHLLPPPKLKETCTKDLESLIINFLKLNKHDAWKQETTGKIIDKREENIDFSGNKRIIGSIIRVKSSERVGRGDIGAKIMININGIIIPVAVELEIKWQKDYQRESQIKYQKNLEEIGGLYFIIKTFDQFIEWYDNFIIDFKNEIIKRK